MRDINNEEQIIENFLTFWDVYQTPIGSGNFKRISELLRNPEIAPKVKLQFLEQVQGELDEDVGELVSQFLALALEGRSYDPIESVMYTKLGSWVAGAAYGNINRNRPPMAAPIPEEPILLLSFVTDNLDQAKDWVNTYRELMINSFDVELRWTKSVSLQNLESLNEEQYNTFINAIPELWGCYHLAYDAPKNEYIMRIDTSSLPEPVIETLKQVGAHPDKEANAFYKQELGRIQGLITHEGPVTREAIKMVFDPHMC